MSKTPHWEYFADTLPDGVGPTSVDDTINTADQSAPPFDASETLSDVSAYAQRTLLAFSKTDALKK